MHRREAHMSSSIEVESMYIKQREWISVAVDALA
jgi:hypothetical protein